MLNAPVRDNLESSYVYAIIIVLLVVADTAVGMEACAVSTNFGRLKYGISALQDALSLVALTISTATDSPFEYSYFNLCSIIEL